MEPVDWEKKRRENARNKLKVPDGDKQKAARLWGLKKKGAKGEQEEKDQSGTGEGDG